MKLNVRARKYNETETTDETEERERS